jgi:hypothetical protein
MRSPNSERQKKNSALCAAPIARERERARASERASGEKERVYWNFIMGSLALSLPSRLNHYTELNHYTHNGLAGSLALTLSQLAYAASDVGESRPLNWP